MACPSCGSWAVKADRGLAGRMVCARCGHPLGLAVSAGGGRRFQRRWGVALPRRWRLWLMGLGLLGVSMVLALQAPDTERRTSPRMVPGSQGHQGWPTMPGGLGM